MHDSLWADGAFRQLLFLPPSRRKIEQKGRTYFHTQVSPESTVPVLFATRLRYVCLHLHKPRAQVRTVLRYTQCTHLLATYTLSAHTVLVHTW